MTYFRKWWTVHTRKFLAKVDFRRRDFGTKLRGVQGVLRSAGGHRIEVVLHGDAAFSWPVYIILSGTGPENYLSPSRILNRPRDDTD